jgi:hypothetical protein
MGETRSVPQTTHTKGEKYSCGDGRYYWKQKEGVPLCFYRRHVQMETIFTHTLNNKSNKADTLKTVERNKISRKLLNKMPIIFVNWANIIHTQFNSRVVREVSTAQYQYVVIQCQLSSGKNKDLCKFCNLLCIKKVKDEYVYWRGKEQNMFTEEVKNKICLLKR